MKPDEHSAEIAQFEKTRATFRIRQLLDELQVLMGSFPDLRDAFEADELPLAFILRRDSRLTEADAWRRRTFSELAKSSVCERTTWSRTPHRGGRRKQMSDE